MSRIQNILEKAERDGTAMRTGRLSAPSAAAVPSAPPPMQPAAATPMNHVAATVPMTIDIPAPPMPIPPAQDLSAVRDIVPGIVPRAQNRAKGRGRVDRERRCLT